MSILSLPFVDLEERPVDLEQLPGLAQHWISQYLSDPSVVLLQAEVGVGKTTLLQHVLPRLGVDPQYLLSPTFSLHHILLDSRGVTHHHFDLYRIRSLFELEELELDAYLAQNSTYVWLEWADILPASWLPQGRKCYRIHIQLIPESSKGRLYRLQKYAAV